MRAMSHGRLTVAMEGCMGVSRPPYLLEQSLAVGRVP